MEYDGLFMFKNSFEIATSSHYLSYEAKMQ